MSGFGHEILVNVFKKDVLDKKYSKPMLLVTISVLAVVLFFLSQSDPKVSFMEGDVNEQIALLIGLCGMSFVLVIVIPSKFRMGRVYYCKTVLTNKWEYDEFMRTKSKKEDWKR